MEASITFKKVGQLIDGKTILAGLTFGIERNSTVAIIGDNDDSGLSEFLRIIAGISIPNYGSVYISGFESLKKRNEIRKFIGYVPFENDMDPWLTAQQNIDYINSFYNIDKKKLKEKFDYFANALDVRDSLNVEVNKLSPGVLRKTTLLRELMREPEILVLDQPNAFMNAKDSELIWNILHEISGKVTIVYSSYSLTTIEKFHDRILVFHNGTIDLDDNFNNMLRNWIGRYEITIQFEKLLEKVFRDVRQVEGVISAKKENNILTFNANERSTLLSVLSLLSGVTISDINLKRLHLKDLLTARYEDEGII